MFAIAPEARALFEENLDSRNRAAAIAE